MLLSKPGKVQGAKKMASSEGALMSTTHRSEKASSPYPNRISPVPSPDSQSPEDPYVKPAKKRVLESFSYHKIGSKRLRQCQTCGSLKLLKKNGHDVDEVCTSTSSDLDDACASLDKNRVSALDYMISKCLVQKEDAPFKPQNTNIRGVLNQGENKVCILDIVELQIEKSFKAQKV